MQSESTYTYPWVVFKLKDNLFAVSSEYVQSMVITPPCTPVPSAPDALRGVVNLRGRIIPLVDLRKRLGMTSMVDEVEHFTTNMDERQKDHEKWLAELEACGREGRAFTMQRDPTKCAFGRWYADYVPETYFLQTLFAAFDAPHRAIHGLADRVDERVRAGAVDEAKQIVADARTRELAEMIRLFGEVRREYRLGTVEIAMVVEYRSVLCAFAVDTIESVETLAEGSITEVTDALMGYSGTHLLPLSGRRKKDNALVFIMDIGEVLEDFSQVTTE